MREALEGGGAMLGALRRSWGVLYTAREGRSKWEIMRSEKQSVARRKTMSTNHNGRPQECESVDPQTHTQPRTAGLPKADVISHLLRGRFHVTTPALRSMRGAP